MTPSELKYNVENSGLNPYFFDHKSMKFFGDTMKNYGCKSVVVHVSNGVEIDGIACWELYRKYPVKHGLKSSTYFDKKTFAKVYPTKD